MAQMYMCTCSVCGETFLAKTPKASVCVEKSTCRVKRARANKKAQIEADKMTVTLEQHHLFEAICQKNGAVGSGLAQMLKMHGKEAFQLMLVTVAYMYQIEV